jgi:hypothetical protein
VGIAQASEPNEYETVEKNQPENEYGSVTEMAATRYTTDDGLIYSRVDVGSARSPNIVGLRAPETIYSGIDIAATQKMKQDAERAAAEAPPPPPKDKKTAARALARELDENEA